MVFGDDFRSSPFADPEDPMPRICHQLLSAEADPNVSSEGHLTPLMLAASNGHEETVRLLLDSREIFQVSSTMFQVESEMAGTMCVDLYGICRCVYTHIYKYKHTDTQDICSVWHLHSVWNFCSVWSFSYMGRFRFNNTPPSSERGPRFLIVGRKRVSAYDLWQCPCYRLWPIYI